MNIIKLNFESLNMGLPVFMSYYQHSYNGRRIFSIVDSRTFDKKRNIEPGFVIYGNGWSERVSEEQAKNIEIK